MKTKKDIEKLMNEISKMLMKFNFKIDSIGFKYWIYAIYYIIRNKDGYYKMEEIYKNIADIYKTNKRAVERAMRRSSENAKERILYYFEYYQGKLTNKTILNLLFLYCKGEDIE